MDIKVFDKVKWHYPDGKGCSSLEAAKAHIEILMEWLSKNNLLSEYGLEIYELGIDSETSITSEMLNKLGNEILDNCYEDRAKSINYNEKVSTAILGSCLKKFSNK